MSRKFQKASGGLGIPGKEKGMRTAPRYSMWELLKKKVSFSLDYSVLLQDKGKK